jgi:capsid protein
MSGDRKLLDWARKHRVMLMPQGASLDLIQSAPPQLGDFILWSLRFIARSLGVSFERLTYDLTKTSFSSTKFGDRDDLITVKEHQHIVVSALHAINRRILLKVALENGLLSADRPAALTQLEHAVKFMMPQRPPIDERVFEEANRQSIENLTNSRQRIAASIGAEWGHINSELGAEAKQIIETRKQVYTALGVEDEEARKMAIEDFRGEKLTATDSTNQAVTEEAVRDVADERERIGAA